MVIIYNTLLEAQTLCDKMQNCKAESDKNYCVPMKKYNQDLWAVQILNKDLSHLTADEFSNREELPSDWFPSDL